MSLRPPLVAAAVLLAGCAALQPSSARVHGGRGDVRPRFGATPGDPVSDPSMDPGRGDVRGGPARPSSAATRRGCRAGARPSGYIAVAYEAASGDECPKGNAKTSDHPVAVYVRYAAQPVGAMLDVCADQPTPIEWVDDDGNVDSGQCPGASPNGGSAMKRIRRVR